MSLYFNGGSDYGTKRAFVYLSSLANCALVLARGITLRDGNKSVI